MQSAVSGLYGKIDQFLLRRYYPLQVALFYLFSYLVVMPFLPLLFVLEKIEGVNNAGPDPDFFMAVVAGPLLETLIFQYIIFKVLRKIMTDSRPLWFICISAFLFGLSHCYSHEYMIVAGAKGLALGYIFYFYRRNLSIAFWTTALVHAMHNATASLLAYYNVIPK